MFGGENPIGKIISFNKEIELTVKGTYAALPENCTMRPKAVISLPSIWSRRIEIIHGTVGTAGKNISG